MNLKTIKVMLCSSSPAHLAGSTALHPPHSLPASSSESSLHLLESAWPFGKANAKVVLPWVGQPDNFLISKPSLNHSIKISLLPNFSLPYSLPSWIFHPNLIITARVSKESQCHSLSLVKLISITRYVVSKNTDPKSRGLNQHFFHISVRELLFSNLEALTVLRIIFALILHPFTPQGQEVWKELVENSCCHFSS